MRRVFRFAPFILLIALWGCGQDDGGGNTPGAPQITSFTASPSTIAASGTPVVLSWTITGTVTSLSIDNGIGSVTGNSRTVNPTATTTYTLTAGNSSGNATKSVTVTVGGGAGGEPTGTFGGSLSQTGPYQSDASGGISDPNDSRIVRAEPNTTIYFQASYTDTDGIASVVPYLANDNVDTDLTPGTPVYGFTSAGATGCTLDGTQTAVTCTFAVAVGNIPNITDVADFEGEFAYVFKVNVTDGAGTVTTNSSRAYVTVGESGGNPDPTSPDPTDPTTPDPTDPDPTDPDPTNPDPTTPTPTTYALTVTKSGSGSGTVTGSSINCGSDCSETYNSGTSVPLTAAAASGSSFAGWSGACSGTGTCQVTMNAAKSVTATFNATGTPSPFTVSVEEVSDLTLGVDGIASTTLNANVSNAPAGTTYKWTASGANAGSVVFDPDNAMDTGATFNEAGTYNLTLTATGGTPAETQADSVSVVVKAAATDTTPPDVTINEASSQSDPATSLPILFTAIFSEPVTGFTDGDITLGGAGATATVSGGPATYTISVSGVTEDSTVTASIAAGIATDAAGNSNTASISTDNTVSYDAP